jgi:hypothetical protein
MIRDIYLALAQMQVGDVPCRNLDEIKLQIQVQDTPVRLLLPSTEGELGFRGIGSGTTIAWRIRDLCLWQPIQSGTGIEQCADEMLAYLELYSQALRNLRVPTTQSSITNVVYTMSPVAWASGDFWAIDIILEVEEYST